MQTTTTGPTPAGAWEPRRARRSGDDTVVGGVASGLARHLGLPTLWVRVAFVALIGFGGLGAVLYAGLWLVLPVERPEPVLPPGLEAAGRQGRRPRPRARRLTDLGPLVAVGAIAIGVLALITGATGTSFAVWPLLLALTGVAVLWRQADEAQRVRWQDSTGRVNPLRAVVGDGGWAAWTRIVLGLGLLVGAIVLFSLRSGSLSAALNIGLAATLGILGLGLMVGPWLVRLSADLTEEREARVRSQERADMAAHLHDSVLQTLALIQRSAADPSAVARLARAQERDLRSWLFESEQRGPATLATALREAAAEVEDTHGVPVEVVCVGDADLTEDDRVLVQAAREAIINAVRHSGAPSVDVYAEVAPGAVEVFVRDRGCGFDPDAVAADRHGLRSSIVGRMERHGGTATVRSAPGEGVEVRLRWPRQHEQAPREQAHDQQAHHEQGTP